MIINHPGCERLDLLLKRFTVLLQSNGIKVKIPFVDDCELHEAGGIGSYLTRNINSCDYVMVLFNLISTEGNT